MRRSDGFMGIVSVDQAIESGLAHHVSVWRQRNGVLPIHNGRLLRNGAPRTRAAGIRRGLQLEAGGVC